MTLNEGQQAALESVLKGESIFLTGPGGTGKSFLIERIVQELTKKGKKVGVTALTGCAALLLGKHAKTIHSWSGIGLGREPAVKIAQDISKNPRRFKTRSRWLTHHTLIIDEVSMMTPEVFELLNEVSQLVRRNMAFFGGIQLILVGDFFQLPPVVKNQMNTAEEAAAKPRFVFESPLWDQMSLKIHRLAEIVRQKDPTFHKVLSEAQTGSLTDQSIQVLMGRQTTEWQQLKIRPTLLFSRRAEVDMINESNLKALPGKPHTFEAKTTFNVDLPKTLDKNSPEVQRAIDKLDRDCQQNPKLVLKQGAQVMLIFNLDVDAGLVNGSRGVVEGFTETVPPLPLVLFKGATTPIPISEASWESEEIEGVFRKQIPLILAQAITIHKSQGSTLDSALIDVGPSSFEVGQAYVALSRVKSLESLQIYDLDPRAFKAHPKVLRFQEGIV